jgi:DNA-binding transcriptional LysR family regulator
MIELRHLRYFIAVAEELNFRRAAERVHVDQTPLSRTIRDLEDRLSVQLFVRAPRKLHLTPAGHKLLQEARKLFIRFERTKRAVRQTHALYQAPLRIGVADGIAHPKLSECLNRWQTASPQVPLELVEMRARELVAALKNEDVDVGFSFGVPHDELIAQTPAWNYRMMAVLPRGHELGTQPVVFLQDLLAFPLLSWSEERLPGLLAQVRAVLHKYAKPSAAVGEALTLSGYVIRIASGAGVGLSDAGHAHALQRDDVVTRPLVEEEYITTFVLHKSRRLAEAESVQRFLTLIKDLS